MGRVVGIAGGRRKIAAIRGALAGKWINVLITDRMSAEHLLVDKASLASETKPSKAGRRR